AGAPHTSLAEARIARVAHDRPRATAARAGLLQLEESLRDTDLPGSAAGLAGGGTAALGSARAMAGFAFREPLQANLALVAEAGRGGVELERVAKAGAGVHRGAAAAARTTEDVAEHTAEDVAEGVRPDPAAASAAAGGGFDACVTVLIVGRPLLRVSEHLAGF